MAVYKDKNTNTWYFTKRVISLGGEITQARKRGFRTKSEAKVAEANYSPKEAAKNSLTFESLYNRYISYTANKIKPSTLESKMIVSKKYILPYFNKIKVDKITTEKIFSWQQEIRKVKISIARMNKIIGELQYIFEYGQKILNVVDNPIAIVGKFKDNSIKDSKIKIWTYEEFKQFISAVDNDLFFAFFNLLYFTGIRKGEALALKWKDIDFKNKKITINKTVTYTTNSKNKYEITSPKTKSSYRVVQLSNSVIEILKSYRKKQQLIYKNLNFQHFLFYIDRPMPKTSIDRYKTKICKLNKIRNIRIHDLRHSHVSLLLSKGIDPLYIAKRLGHADVTTTLNTYSHIMPEREMQIKEVLENL